MRTRRSDTIAVVLLLRLIVSDQNASTGGRVVLEGGARIGRLPAGLFPYCSSMLLR